MQSNSSTIAGHQSCSYAQNSDENIHVVLAVYDPSGTYSQHAGVVMTSIFENTKSKVTVHILHDDTLTEENKQKFIRTAEKYSQGLNLVNVSEYAESLSKQVKKAAEHWTIGTLYRLFIPEILPELEKVIYLDCDVIVNLDISELWNVDIEHKSLGAVLDEVPEILKAYSARNLQLRLIRADKKTYVNAGVLVMNLHKIRSCSNFSETILEYMTRYAHLLMCPDQDAFNLIFSGDIKILDTKFNVYKLNQNLSGCIIHMWAEKPWRIFSGAEHERLYWKYYLLSAWGDNITPEGMMLKLSDLASRSQVEPKPRQPILRRFAKFLWHIVLNIIRKYMQETYRVGKILCKYVSHGMIRP